MASSPRLTLLGGLTLTYEGAELTLPFSAQRLIAFLAVQPRAFLRSRVASCLWPDSSEVRASASLRSALWRLQRPGVPLVLSTASHLRLAEGVGVDTREVVDRARRLMNRSLPCPQQDLAPAPLMGEFLPDWSGDEWVLVERERLRQLCLHALESLCERLQDLGRHGEAIEAALAAVRGEPLRESARRVLIAVHLEEGNLSEALREYGSYERLLHDELGIEPSPLITGLVRDLQSADDAAHGGGRAPVTSLAHVHDGIRTLQRKNSTHRRRLP